MVISFYPISLSAIPNIDLEYKEMFLSLTGPWIELQPLHPGTSGISAWIPTIAPSPAKLVGKCIRTQDSLGGMTKKWLFNKSAAGVLKISIPTVPSNFSSQSKIPTAWRNTKFRRVYSTPKNVAAFLDKKLRVVLINSQQQNILQGSVTECSFTLSAFKQLRPNSAAQLAHKISTIFQTRISSFLKLLHQHQSKTVWDDLTPLFSRSSSDFWSSLYHLLIK